MNYLQRKKWAIMRAGTFHGYLRRSEGYPLTLTCCMPEYPVSLSVSGNTVQDGTPSPDNPVEVRGCGERTDNLFYPTQGTLTAYGVTMNVTGDIITLNGTVTSASGATQHPGFKLSNGIDSVDGTANTSNAATPASWHNESLGLQYGVYTLSKHYISGEGRGLAACVRVGNDVYFNHGIDTGISVEGSPKFIYIYLGNTSKNITYTDYKFRIMLNEGDTPLSYEPYGYKVPVQLDKPTEVTAVLTPQIDRSGIQLSINGGTTTTGVESLSLSKPIQVKPGYSYSTSGNCRFRFYKGYISSSNALGTIKEGIVTNAIAPEDAVYAYISFETAKYGEFTVVERGTVHEYKTLNLYTDAPLYGNGDVSDTVELDVANKKATLTQRISVSDIGEITQLATPVTTDISSMQDWDSIPKLWRGTAVITADTTVQPSTLVCDYYSKNRVWGVRFPTATLSSSPTGTRTCLAKGMIAKPSTDTVKNQNDFDNVPAFRYDYVNGYLDENNVFVETAIKGKDDSFAFDGSNGDVYSRFKLSYWRRLTGDGYVEYQITHEYIPNDGWCPFGIFVNPDGTLNDYAYIASYEMGYNSEGLCASMSGVPVAHNTYANRNATTAGLSHNTQLTEFRKKGTQYCGMTSKEVMFLQYLFMIEFATLNSQSIMYGATNYNYQYKVTVAETGVERVVVANTQANNFIVGSTVSVGVANGTSLDRSNSSIHSIVNRKRVTSKEALSDGVNTAIYIDNGGNTFDTTADTVISTMPWYTGITDSVLGSSGSPVSNTNGKYPMKYRGVENLYGNMWTIISDVIVSSYVPYVCYDCTKFSTGVTSDYNSLNYSIATSGGYAKELGYDSTHPSVQIPISVGGSSSTYLCDYYYVLSGVREVLFGGNVYHGAHAGLFCFYCYIALSSANWTIAARLSVNGRHGAAVT